MSDVYRRYGVVLGRRARLFLRDDALAQDAVQEFLTMLLRRGEGMRDAESPWRWMCRAMDRVCLDLLRRSKRSRDAMPLDDLDRVGPAPGVDAADRRAVLQSLERLNEQEQAIAIGVFVDGMSQGEVAAELGLSRVTVNKYVQRIRAELIEQLESNPSLPTEEPS
ncbi:RNA polymerase sigma factor [Labilithrix luteola]|uniref:RNA polymerase sigma factor n=1 Tax=Labilithrix luteola TaxID=1391654 RepID=UPI001F0AA5FF|nr:sigma-70 family RNA polymerase sigma factor [Labilithrix luteola]